MSDNSGDRNGDHDAEHDREHNDEQKSDAERFRERVEEQMGEAREQLSGLIPPDFADHFRTARREFWLAVRSLVDARLDSIEDEAKPKSPRNRGKIDID
jgi:hypothetical protein